MAPSRDKTNQPPAPVGAHPSSPRRRLISRLLLVVFSVAASLLAAELGLRLKALRDDARQSAALARLTQAAAPPAGSDVGLNRIIRLCAFDSSLYELIPNLDVRFMDQQLTTDSSGYRLTMPSSTGSGQARTILGIGDSFMFGWGVADGDTYLARLATVLNPIGKPTRWRVLNAAVPGYNTAIEIEILEHRLQTVTPDVVIIHYVINDLDLPNFIRRHDSFWTLERSFLRERVSSERYRFRQSGLNRLIDVPFNPQHGRFELPPDRVPDAYRHRYGRPSFEQALTRLKAMSVANGFKVIVLADMTPPSYVRAACEREALQLVTTESAVRRYCREKGFRQHSESDLILSTQDSHPSVRGHELIAAVLTDALERMAP
ncbi:MAG: SGNH/GDSL hydrolase family protein [Verrucomicrobia bacterium]|nr:SGNH/GDSL hydrolase family protein [Verrucomicrobiota bacterium]